MKKIHVIFVLQELKHILTHYGHKAVCLSCSEKLENKCPM